MNSICLVGRLTKDPEVKYYDNSTMCTFTIAVDDPFSKDKKTDFIPCQAWGKRAELIGEHLKKGERIGVVGRLKLESYKADDGSYKNFTKVIVDQFDFLSEKKGDNEFSAVSMDEVPF